MATAKMRFSSAGALAIQHEFTRAADPLMEALNTVERTVETLREWWEGETADQFVEVSRQLKTQVKNEIDGWLDKNKQLIKNIEEMKFDGERRLAGGMRSTV